LDVMLVAARREKVSNYTGVLSQVGKNPTVVDVDAFALENAFEAGYEPPPDQTCALLNLGASLTNVNIVRNGIPLFTRDIPVGGKHYTEALQKALELSFDEAERVKLGGEMPQVSAEVRKSALQAVSASLVGEVQKTFSFFRQMTGAEAIDRIYLAGGTARIEGLAERVQEELKIPVEVLDPLRQITVSSDEFDSQYIADLAPRLAVAVGLALRSFDTA
jgi:type IV pilus assembly protein PilM